MAARAACTTSDEPMETDAPGLVAAAEGLPNKSELRSKRFVIRGLRLAHRDRRKTVHFYRLIDALGRDVFAIFNQEDLDSRPADTAAFALALSTLALGDVVTLVGYPARRDGWSACLIVTSYDVEVRWAEEHTGKVFIVAEPVCGSVLFQCPSSHAKRVAEYCQAEGFHVPCAVAGTCLPPWEGKDIDRCVSFTCHGPHDALALAAHTDPFLASVVSRVLITPERAMGLGGALAAISAALKRRGVQSARLVTFPRSLTDALAAVVGASGVALEPKRGRHTHVVALAWANGAHAWGVESAQAYGASARSNDNFLADAATSRAYYKLREALTLHYGHAVRRAGAEAGAPGGEPRTNGAALAAGAAGGRAVAPPLLRGLHALDLGAAPGGWTSCLVEHGAAHVAAVDPAELAAAVLALPQVEHMRMRSEQAMAVLRARGERFDVLVCDMNCAPAEAAAMVQTISGAVRPRGLLVLTLKRTARNGEQWKAAVAEAERLLARSWCEVRIVHLFANTNHERTILARKRRFPHALTPLVAGSAAALALAGALALGLALALSAARARRA